MSARPDSYTHGHHESVLRSHRWRTAENSAGYLLPYLRPGQSLLDVGCGPGTITKDLAQRLAPGRVVGIDPSADAVGTARAALLEAPPPAANGRGSHRAEPDGGAGSFDFGAGAGQAMATPPLFEVTDLAGYVAQWPDERFDVVHAHQVLQHLADPVGALRLMAGLAAPGGVVAARDSDYSAMTWYPDLPELAEWARLYQAAARANGAEPDAGRRLLSWARAAGFAEITPSASTWCFATPESRAWWGGLWADRITESALAAQLVGRSLATTDELAAVAAGWRRWAEHPDGWFSVLHGEIVCRVADGGAAGRAGGPD